MGKTSDDVLKKNNPERRTFVLTRSGNVGTFKYAASTWTGDNATRSVELGVTQSYGG
jgi:alpha-glucosidase (family GH31 glycosyl hydrolase)